MQDLALDTVDGGAAPDTAAAVVPEQPGTPDAAQRVRKGRMAPPTRPRAAPPPGKKPPPLPTSGGRERRARGRFAIGRARGRLPAAPVDVAAILKARAAAKKGGRKGKPASAAAQAALANAKARPQRKSGAKGGRSEGGPRAAKTGKSQNDKCLP